MRYDIDPWDMVTGLYAIAIENRDAARRATGHERARRYLMARYTLRSVRHWARIAAPCNE